jgi:hypothetical protein
MTWFFIGLTLWRELWSCFGKKINLEFEHMSSLTMRTYVTNFYYYYIFYHYYIIYIMYSIFYLQKCVQVLLILFFQNPNKMEGYRQNDAHFATKAIHEGQVLSPVSIEPLPWNPRKF